MCAATQHCGGACSNAALRLCGYSRGALSWHDVRGGAGTQSHNNAATVKQHRVQERVAKPTAAAALPPGLASNGASTAVAAADAAAAPEVSPDEVCFSLAVSEGVV